MRVVERGDGLAHALEVLARERLLDGVPLRGHERGRDLGDAVALALEDAARFLDEVAALEAGPLPGGSLRHQRRLGRSPAARCSVDPVANQSVHLQDRQEGLLRDLHVAHLLHPLLTFLLTLQQLALARDVAAVALGGDVLAQRLDRRARR